MERTSEIFRALLSEGSFQGAARALGLTQSYLSQFVRRLEEKAQGSLINRQSRPLELTELGRFVYRNAMRIEAIERETENFCSDYADLKVGTLRIASNSERTSAILVRAVRRFVNDHPRVSIDLSLDLSLEEVPGAIQMGKADVGITFERLMPKGLNALPLMRERYLLALPDVPELAALGRPYDPQGDYPVLDPKDAGLLCTLPLLNTLNHPERQMTLARALHRDIAVLPVSVRTCANRLSMVESGLCMAICQEHLVHPYSASRKCRFISLENILPVQTVVIAWSETAYQSRAAREFCRCASALARQGGLTAGFGQA